VEAVERAVARADRRHARSRGGFVIDNGAVGHRAEDGLELAVDAEGRLARCLIRNLLATHGVLALGSRDSRRELIGGGVHRHSALTPACGHEDEQMQQLLHGR
jgi:hypothetical protein